MKHDEFTRFMKEHDFEREQHPLGYSPSFCRVRNGVLHYVVRDNVRGGSFRIFLGHRCVPVMDPPDISSPGSIEAESPWFQYVDGYRTRDEALSDCVSFMERTGLRWLVDPLHHPHEYWMTQEKMLITVNGSRLPVPRPPRVLP